MDIKAYVTVTEAAKIIGCTDGRVRQLLRAGTLAGERVNERAWLVEKDDAKRLAKHPATTGRPRVNGKS